VRTLVSFLAAIIWITGVVIAKGFWSTFFAIVVPAWSWYLVAERIVERYL
jgi:hypothetical protein